MKKQPNILFILVDDMGWTDLSSFGSSFYESPNIDKLAQKGIIYNNAYAASPVCSPSRASIVTGKYPVKVGVTNWCGAGQEFGKVIGLPNNGELGNKETTLAAVLNQNGYSTWHVGKWHLGENQDSWPENNGFDVNIGGCGWGRPKNGYFSPWNIPNLPNGPEGQYLTDRITDEAVNLIKNHDDGKPFFMNLWYYTVHTPIQAKPEKVAKYEKKRIDMGLDKVVETQVGELYNSEHNRGRRITRRLVQSNPTYAAMVEHLDDSVGVIVKTLEEQGLLDDTIIVFTSDNGGLSVAESCPTCNKPLLEGKGWMYEGGVRVPMFVNWGSNIASGTTNETIVNSTDYYKTLLKLVDIECEIENDSFDFSESLKGSKVERDPLYWYYPHYGNQGGAPYAAVRVGDFKLIRMFETETYELYNLSDDLSETTEISKKHPEITKNLRNLVDSWLVETNAYIPTKNHKWIEPVEN